MKFDNTLLTNFLDEYRIRYKVDADDEIVEFEYDGRYLFGFVESPSDEDSDEYGFVGVLVLGMRNVYEAPTSDVKNFLKLVNHLNAICAGVKFVIDEDSNILYIETAIPLDSTPEIDDLVPGLVKLLVEAHDEFNKAIAGRNR